MCQLLETIRVEYGTMCHPGYHLKRMQYSSSELFGSPVNTDILETISIPAQYSEGIYRCRIVYTTAIEKIEFLRYTPRKISSLKIVDDGNIDYTHKYADRSKIENLYARRGLCDDILIIRNGMITDTSIANVLLLKDTTWFTPAEPLLQGTMRQYLLDKGFIHGKNITVGDLKSCKSVMLINALRPFDEEMAFSVKHIF
ncbi:MAG: aminotransferase class IV [Bacteroidota bacterium]